MANTSCDDPLFDWDTESPAHLQMGVSAAINFDCSISSDRECNDSKRSSQHMETKIDMIYKLLAILGEQEDAEIGETFLSLSSNPENCLAMRQSGCLPLLVKLIQSDKDSETRKKAVEALHNLINCQPDEKIRIREIKLLKLIEILNSYTETLDCDKNCNYGFSPKEMEEHPIQTISRIVKLSFDESYRQTMCLLGAIHTIVKLLESEYSTHGVVTEDRNCNILRSHACMTLTNLTFGDSGNKALLCSYKDFIKLLIEQLHTPCDELRQATANIIRNLSWRADSTSKETLKEVGSVENLMRTAMLDNRENTLITILSALWNLSAHSVENKTAICSLDGALEFLIRTMSYKSPFDSSTIVENSGGILKNISSQIAENSAYRDILRKSHCFQILVDQLKSSNSTIVSNACGTLWNLSAHDTADNQLICSLGALSSLETLNKSKHKMIAVGSNALLKNLSRIHSDQNISTQSRNSKGKPKLSCDEINPSRSDQSVSSASSSFLLTKSMELKSSSLVCLSMRENSNSNNDKRTQMLKGGSLSLPHVYSTKYKDLSTDATDYIESSEETLNIGRRYSETRPSHNASKNECLSSYEQSNNESFSIYAETDLDQPTDYSLRYAENNADTDSECIIAEKTSVGFVTDTIKTYCTEGTPYETPANFSTSTSISDLRIMDKNTMDNEKLETEEKKSNQLSMVSIAIPTNSNCIIKSNEEREEKQPTSSKSIQNSSKSEFSSGLVSPEKPMNYCEEGTPGYFSRVSSLGSLNSTPTSTGEEKLPKKNENNGEILAEGSGLQQKISASENKMVKFEENVNFYEETPLMFSRSSSLGSLDSIEQQSIHDDRSSLISDFSRLTSGIISPSELPDSPTQTAPSSPKPRKSQEYQTYGVSSDCKSNPIRRTIQKNSVFEDGVTKFKEENTPVQFSTTTSLSNLTIEDQEENDILESSMGNGISVNQDEEQYSPEPSGVLRLTDWKNVSPTNNFCLAGPSEQSSSQILSSTVNFNHCAEEPTPIIGTIEIDKNSGTHFLGEVVKEIVTSKDGSFHENGRDTIKEIEESLFSKLQIQSKIYFEANKIDPSSSSTDEMTYFTVEDSPIEFSLKSSLSSLTFRSDGASGLDNSFGSKTCDIKLIPADVENSENKLNNSSFIENKIDDNVHYDEEPSNSSIINNTSHLPVLNSHHVDNFDDNIIKDSFAFQHPKEERGSEIQNNIVSQGSLKRKKWKWKWKLKAERPVESNTKETSSEKEFVTSSNVQGDSLGIHKIIGTDSSNYGSLDASFRKKKWWKWMNNSKEAEYHHNCQIDNPQTPPINNKDETEHIERTGTCTDKSNFSRNISKRWKWRWKFSSESKSDGDPSGLYKPNTMNGRFSMVETTENCRTHGTVEAGPISNYQREPLVLKIHQTNSQHISETRVDQSVISTRNSKYGDEVPEEVTMRVNTTSSVDDIDSPALHKSQKNNEDCNEIYDDSSNFNGEGLVEDGEYVELRKAIQIPESESSISEASSCSSIAEVFDEISTTNSKEESARSEITDINSATAQISNLSTNDFEFLKRQVKMSDKHRLWELIDKGISKEEEISLVRDLVLKRVKEENEMQMRSLTSGNKSPSSNELRISQKKNIFEEPLDPMTLSIVRRILGCKLPNNEEKSRNLCSEETSSFSDCNVESESENFNQISGKSVDESTRNESPSTSTLDASSLSGQSKSVAPFSNMEKVIQSQDLRNESNHNNSSSTSCDNKDYAVLIEECIRLGMPKKKEIEQETIYANVPKLPGYSCASPIPRKEISSQISTERRSKISDNTSNLTDAQLLIEECIKLGMPKKIGEPSRWNNKQNIPPKSYELRLPSSNMDSNGNDQITDQRSSAFSTLKNKGRLDPDEQKEEAIYANVSNAIGYSRFHKMDKFENSPSFPTSITTSHTETGFEKGASNYMPVTRDSIHHQDTNNSEIPRLNNKSVAPCTTPNYESLIEECILLGMPNNKECLRKHMDTHSVSASLPRGVPKSYSEPSNLRNPFANISKPMMANNSSNGTFREIVLSSSEVDSLNDNCEYEFSTSGRAISRKQKETRPKNVNVASVVRNIKSQRGVPGTPILAIDAIGSETRSVLDKIKTSSRNIVHRKNGFSHTTASVNNFRQEKDTK